MPGQGTPAQDPPAQDPPVKILLLAPHPFYQNRGTPIAVDLLVRTLCDAGHSVDIITFNEGQDRHYPNLRMFRVGKWLAFKNIRPGFSVKKLLLDALMIPHVGVRLARERYDVIHAVEESAFIAWFYSVVARKPFIYDMDSSLATQLSDKLPSLKRFVPLLRWLESIPIKRALFVVPVCDALEQLASQLRPSGVVLLKDISMLDTSPVQQMDINIQNQLVAFDSLFDSPRRYVLYVGNMESYQGIDLMLESFARAVSELDDLALILVGGNDLDIATYRTLAESLGITAHTRFLGPRPIALLKAFCDQAQLLLSPRILGENTPMKLYSYLGSGVPVLATDLPTHTEVVDDQLAYLATTTPQAFSATIVNIFNDYETATLKADNAARFIDKQHSLKVFQQRVLALYAQISEHLEHQ